MPDEAATRVQDVKKRHLRRLLAIDGVVGVGISEEPSERDERAWRIRLYVEKLDDQTRQKLPTELDGFATEVREVGRAKLTAND